ncbi:universal stress protein [Streptomyces sp. NPDC005574]|uniref:universal stress protein n=1 Tax=Streptomyces sp. NPDC005574 TaxID=3156891 RepID=UPI0033BAC355
MPAITVGLDGSPESLDAAAWAAREAARRQVPLRLVHAVDLLRPWYASFAGFPAPGAIDVQREWAAHVLREERSRLMERHPGLWVTTRQVTDQAVRVLLASADDSELLVLGSRRFGTVAGFLVGSVALAVVARARRPVVLVRAGGLPEDERLPDAAGAEPVGTPCRDVVLGLDRERPGDTVIEFAFDAARRRAAGLRVVHGWSPVTSHGYGAVMDAGLNEELADEARNGVGEVLRPWKDKFPEVEVRQQAVIGGAARHLVQASRDSALVVVGRRARRDVAGGRIGPVTHAVLQHASAPVAVVPHD